MSLSLDIADDLDLADGQETVTVADRAGGWSSGPVLALPRALRTFEIVKSNGAYRAGDLRWHAKASDVGHAPKPGDTLTRADAVPLVILSVDTATLQTRYAMVTRRLVIEGSTVVTAEWMKPTGRQDEAGADVLEFAPTGQSFTCQLQTMDVPEQETEDGRRQPRQHFRLFMPTRPALESRDAFRINGTLYRWLASADSDRIDMLPSVDLDVLPL